MKKIIGLSQCAIHFMNITGGFVSMLALRLLLAWEFWEAGFGKLSGDNWFADIQQSFPFPFNVIPVNVSWFIATWSEIIGALALTVGFGTRFFAIVLLILDIVAWASVHANNGYNVCNNGFQLPLIYMIMLIPLIFSGPGKASLDHLIAQRFKK